MKKYSDITKEDIEKAIKEVWGEDADKLTYDELRSRVLTGYWYSINSNNEGKQIRKTKINTGSGGALAILDQCEKAGLPAFIIAQDIICYTDQGPYPLSQLKVKKNEL